VDDILHGLNYALEAMNRGDVEPAVALLDPDVDWRGRPQGHLWWRHSPSCHGPHEARRNLELQVDKGQASHGVKRFSLEQVAQVGECVVVAGRWEMADGSNEAEGRFYQVLRVRGGLIVDIQGCTSRRAAMAYARRAA
jgi:ketosteroid isomerase-like protein